MNPRSDVLWCGAPPTADDEANFSLFGLRIVPTEGQIPVFERARALVISGFAPHIDEAERNLEHVRSALDSGCFVYVLAEDDATQQRLQSHFNFQHERVRIHTVSADRVPYARVIDRHDAGPPSNDDLVIVRTDGSGDFLPEHELLVRRAFSDAIEVRLDPLPGGQSGAVVYQANARLKHSVAGPLAMPFFVKLGPRDKIAAERRNYEDYATIHVPFHLRPNLMGRRCVDGSSQAALVGSLVENGRPLASVAHDADGAAAVRYLLTETLRGWRAAATEREPERGCLGDRLERLVNSLIPALVSRASSFGNVYEPSELRARLINLEQQTFFVGPVHGDLHGENVYVVRGPYAILLDFGTVSRGPIVADVANLDVWLACEPFADGDGTPSFEEWCDAMNGLYSLDLLVGPPDQGLPSGRFAALAESLRELRLCGFETMSCQQEYPVAVALHLAARAKHLDTYDEDEANRRAFAYFLACRLTDELHRM